MEKMGGFGFGGSGILGGRGLDLGFKVCGLRLWLDFSDTVQGLKASQTLRVQGSK